MNDLDEGDFELALDGASGSFRDLLHSIYEQWQSGRRLSPRQIEVVKDAADRSSDRHPGGRFR